MDGKLNPSKYLAVSTKPIDGQTVKHDMEYKDIEDDEKHSVSSGHQLTTIERLEKLHPYQMMLYLFLVGSSIIFLFLLIAHFATRPSELATENFFLPKPFIFSTFAILASSYFLSKAVQLFINEQLIQLRNSMGLAVMLGVVFAISQYIGWIAMIDQGILFEGRTGGVYLYILSGLHFVHLLGGLLYLFMSFLEILRISKDPIKSLVATTNPYYKLKIRLLVTYWIYLDITWLVVFFYFLFSY